MNEHQPTGNSNISRRSVLRKGTLTIAGSIGLSSLNSLQGAVVRKPMLRIGLVTDLHFADKPPAGTRHYRETRQKLSVARHQFTASPPDFVVELGDFIDAAESVESELSYLRAVNQDFSTICDERHYVLGNHCVHTLTKSEFLKAIDRPRSYYSFDKAGFHFVILDACFRGDGEPYGRGNFKWTDANIPEAELKWLKSDLATNNFPTIVFVHQRLDVANNHGVRNAPDVRRILEQSENVLAVFQGHSHKNDHKEISGIHYCTLVAMVEGPGLDNNAFSILEIDSNGDLRVDGFVKQNDYRWGR